VTASPEGGETPIANCRAVMRSLPEAIIEKFRRLGWMYVRNYGDGYGLPWQTVFQTSDRSVVEDHCRRHGIAVEWKDGERLRTRAIRPAITRHPKTGEDVWFNHATFFHVTTLEPSIRESLLAQFTEEELPTNTFYGDGSPIEPEVLEQLRHAYEQNKVLFPWQPGDVLLLDNMLVAHGRSSYTGPRKVLVAMAEAFSR
jgi:alpha-ketoglutarate-dependent taurine dioxygenase